MVAAIIIIIIIIIVTTDTAITTVETGFHHINFLGLNFKLTEIQLPLPPEYWD